MIPLVTVTYTKDKWQMLLQAHSIEKYTIEPTTHYVIINDEETSFLEWKCLLGPIYKRNKLILIGKHNKPELFLPDYIPQMSGYHTQMVLKLIIAKLIQYPYYVTLDSKNVFHKPIDLNIFDNCEGSADIVTKDLETQEYPECIQYFYGTTKKAQNTFNLNIPDSFWFAGTPFVLKTSTVLSILASVDLYNFVYEIIKNGENFSEYILYGMFSKASKEIRCWSTGYNLPTTVEDCVERLLKEVDTFIVYRHSLGNFIYRNNMKKILLKCDFDERYVVPAIELTSPTDR